jgi:hypothetical protein
VNPSSYAGAEGSVTTFIVAAEALARRESAMNVAPRRNVDVDRSRERAWA